MLKWRSGKGGEGIAVTSCRGELWHARVGWKRGSSGEMTYFQFNVEKPANARQANATT